MFDLIKDIVLKETNFDITNNETYKQTYNSNYSGIFQRVDTDSIIDLNKELLDSQAKLFIDDINQSIQDTQPTKPVPKVSEILQERNSQDILFKKYIKKPLQTPIDSIQKQIIISSLQRIFDLSSNSYHFRSKIKEGTQCTIHSLTLPTELNAIYPYIYLVCKIQDKKHTYLFEYDRTITPTVISYKPCEPVVLIHESKTILFEIKNHVSQKINHKQYDYTKVTSIESKNNKLTIGFDKKQIDASHISLCMESPVTNKLEHYLTHTICKVDGRDDTSMLCEWPHNLEIVAFTSPIYMIPSFHQTTIHATTT